MHKKFEINQTKIKAGCQSGRKVVTHNSKSDLPLHSCQVIQSQSACKKAKERERESFRKIVRCGLGNKTAIQCVLLYLDISKATPLLK